MELLVILSMFIRLGLAMRVICLGLLRRRDLT